MGYISVMKMESNTMPDNSKNIDSVMDALTDNLDVLISASTTNLNEARAELKKFVEDMKYDIDVALTTYIMYPSETSLKTIQFLYAASIMSVQRVGQKFLYKQKQAVAMTVMSTVRGFLAALIALA